MNHHQPFDQSTVSSFLRTVEKHSDCVGVDILLLWGTLCVGVRVEGRKEGGCFVVIVFVGEDKQLLSFIHKFCFALGQWEVGKHLWPFKQQQQQQHHQHK